MKTPSMRLQLGLATTHGLLAGRYGFLVTLLSAAVGRDVLAAPDLNGCDEVAPW